MSYATLAVPLSVSGALLAAKRIAVGMEPDSAYREFEQGAFQMRATDSQGAEYAVYGFDCSDQFAASIPYWQANPAILQDAVEAGYAAKGIDDPVPSTATIQKFTNAVIYSTAYGVLAGLDDLGLTLQAGSGNAS